jgi:hypothetical protein
MSRGAILKQGMNRVHFVKFVRLCRRRSRKIGRQWVRRAGRRAPRQLEVGFPKIARTVENGFGNDPIRVLERTIIECEASWTGLETLFVHVPKCGGTSVNAVLADFDATVVYSIRSLITAVRSLPRTGPKILTLDHLATDVLVRSGLVPAKTLAKVNGFSVVRNPYSRAVSAFRHHQRTGLVKDSVKLGEYLKQVEKGQWETDRWNVFGLSHSMPASYFLRPNLWRGPSSILNIEHPSEIEAFLTRTLGGPVKLPKKNVNQRVPNVQLDKSSIRSVNRIYGKDFLIGGYSTLDPEFFDAQSEGHPGGG